jgi:hypothetical protein
VLTLQGLPFTVGRASFDDALPNVRGSAKVIVKIQLGGLDVPLRAQLDTAAEWSVVATEVAADLGLLAAAGEPKKYQTRLGTFDGKLVKHTIILPADEGDSLAVDATVWVSQEWPGSNFLGYRGLLESVRFALDPQQNDFYFGPS